MAKIFTTYCIGIDGCKDGWVVVYCPVSNFSKAKDELNWKPYYVNEEFKVAIDQTIEWVNNNMSSVITSNYTI